MEKSAPSRFAKARELIDQLRICVALDAEMTDILEELHTHIYGIEEDMKRMVATSRRHDEKINSLETRYSQLLFKFSELNQRLPK